MPPSDKELSKLLPAVRRDSNGPVFAEPWQAQAFAMAVELYNKGVFTWPEWAEYLSEEIKAAGSSDDRGDYYDHWLTALEKIVAAKGVMSNAERLARKDAWDKAARATPHGEPIALPRD